MNTIYLVLFAILIPALAILIFWTLLRPQPKSPTKVLLTIILVLGTILLDGLLVSLSMVPDKADQMLSDGVAILETRLERAQPGCLNEIMNPDKLSTVLSQAHDVKGFVDDNEEVDWLVSLIGWKSFLNMADGLVSDTEEHVGWFAENGVPFTLHNIFDYTLIRTNELIVRIVRILQIIVLVIAALFMIIMIVWPMIMRKDMQSSGSKGVVFGEEA